jgi:metal-responsive CopG/Arc/MetJ family transcriptional regulator
MTQYTFSTEPEFIKEIDAIADRENRSRSEVIVLLLRQAIKERNRKRKPVKHDTHNSN